MKYVHTNIISSNWRKLSEFYIQVFKCQIMPPERNQSGEWLSKGTGVANASLQGVHLLLPGFDKNGPTLEIYQYSNIEQQELVNPNTRGIGHLAFEVDNVPEIYTQVIKYGGSACGDISTREIDQLGQITFVYVRDPDGNLIELQSWRKE